MSYKDMTFCKFYTACNHGATCHRALTDEVKKGAKEWWPENPIICVYTEPPECFVDKANEQVAQ